VVSEGDDARGGVPASALGRVGEDGGSRLTDEAALPRSPRIARANHSAVNRQSRRSPATAHSPPSSHLALSTRLALERPKGLEPSTFSLGS